MSPFGTERRFNRDLPTSVVRVRADIRRSRSNGANDPGCVKTLGGIIAPGILGSVAMRRAKKRKKLPCARHYDEIRFRFRTTKTRSGHSSWPQTASQRPESCAGKLGGAAAALALHNTRARSARLRYCAPVDAKSSRTIWKNFPLPDGRAVWYSLILLRAASLPRIAYWARSSVYP
jgi:hypothetical protein